MRMKRFGSLSLINRESEMSIQSTRKDYVSQNWRLPYQFYFNALIDGFEQAQLAKKETGLNPNHFIIYLSEKERRSRSHYEDFFLDELTHDLVAAVRERSAGVHGQIHLEMRSDKTLHHGRLRIECFNDQTFLCATVREWKSRGGAPLVHAGDQESAQVLQPSALAAPMILVVDDEPMLCAVLQRMLLKLKYRVVTANNGQEALQLLAQMEINLVITDLRMPKMDGWELMKRIKQAQPEIPVVLITGYHSLYSRDMADASAASGYISKPFSFLEIRALLARLLGAQSQSKQSVETV